MPHKKETAISLQIITPSQKVPDIFDHFSIFKHSFIIFLFKLNTLMQQKIWGNLNNHLGSKKDLEQLSRILIWLIMDHTY